MSANSTTLAELAQTANDTFDLASHDDHKRVRSLAEKLRSHPVDEATLRGVLSDKQQPLDLQIAVTLALSKTALERAAWKGRLGFVFAMWGEQRRLLPRDSANPTGEDSLHVKLDQLSWLFEGSSVDWRVYAVDDGDPDDSAAVAQERAKLHDHADRVHVLRLVDALPAEAGPLAKLESVDDSRKGGAILYGAQQAIEAGCDAIVMTDADNSVNLAQAGLLIAPYAAGADVVIGDRKHSESVLVKAEARWGPGIVVLRHMQRMVGQAIFDRGIQDTQAAFKLYGAATLNDILAEPSTFGFAFDSDWLYAAIAGGRAIEAVPFAFIDSFEESASITQGPMTTWESLLRGLVAAARSRNVDHHHEMAAVVDEYAYAGKLETVVQAVPDELSNVDNQDLGAPEVMSAEQLRSWLAAL